MQELQWEELQWEELQWEELQWEELQWDGPQWEELRWEELRWEELQWEELRWLLNQSSSGRSASAVRSLASGWKGVFLAAFPPRGLWCGFGETPLGTR